MDAKNSAVPKKVAQLINRNERCWELESIKDMVSKSDRETIKGVPICKSGGRDQIFWPKIIDVEEEERSRVLKATVESLSLLDMENYKKSKQNLAVEAWEKPKENWVNVNYDGAYNAKTKVAGIGVVERNWIGELIGVFW
ncbi:hypothetical protein GOBAR_DD10984 [Gossypium barbadense]|nr:hypothetical protein GOBAR_DD10984 [Gossypium barbadense]